MSTEGNRAAELIEALDASGIFKDMGYQEIVTACGYIAARSIHEQKNLPPVKTWVAISKIYEVMAEREVSYRDFERSLEEDKAKREPKA